MPEPLRTQEQARRLSGEWPGLWRGPSDLAGAELLVESALPLTAMTAAVSNVYLL